MSVKLIDFLSLIRIVEVKSWTEIVHTRSTIRANEEINKRLSEIGELPNIQPQDEVRMFCFFFSSSVAPIWP